MPREICSLPMAEKRKKRLLLGISAGIAAYKCVDLVRRLVECEFEVRVVLTARAEAFVTPLALQTVSGYAVQTQQRDPIAAATIEHIELARWPDIVLIAPATTNIIARLAHGIADDLLCTLCLATTVTIAIAPAMNKNMWQAEATQANVTLLQQRRVRFLGPASGAQACGEFGLGRMLEPLTIVDQVQMLFANRHLAGRRIMITAGPTLEHLDPVRYFSNHSSGKMGYAIAAAATMGGAEVVLISGPVALAAPPMVEHIQVTSAAEMLAEVLAQVNTCDIFISTAAVADYRPANTAIAKIKRNIKEWSLRMVPNVDILATVAARAKRPFCVGFAAETDDIKENALKKLHNKKLDLVAANRVGASDRGFGADTNELTLFWQDGQLILPLAPKSAIAHALLDHIAMLYEKAPLPALATATALD